MSCIRLVNLDACATASRSRSTDLTSLLGNYHKENAAIILEAIIRKLKKVCKSQTDLKKFIEQLIVISRMRNLEQLTIKISKAMPITYDIETDYLYNLGRKIAEKKLEAFKSKVVQKQAELEAKATKAAQEQAQLEAKFKDDKIASIKKMIAAGLPNDAIFEFSNLDKATFEEYLKIIEADNNNG